MGAMSICIYTLITGKTHARPTIWQFGDKNCDTEHKGSASILVADDSLTKNDLSI